MLERNKESNGVGIINVEDVICFSFIFFYFTSFLEIMSRFLFCFLLCQINSFDIRQLNIDLFCYIFFRPLENYSRNE